jgi:FdhE protein
MMTKSIDSVDPLVQRLRSLARNSPDLNDVAQVYKAILPLLRDADLRVSAVSMTQEQARAKLDTGLPLLHDLDLELDVESVRDLMLRLAHAVENSGEKNHASRIRLALEENRLDINRLLPHIAAGERDAVISMAQRLDLDAGLVWTLAQNAFKPALRAWCKQLAPLAERIPWYKGSCFVCGADATLAELRGNNLVKHLRCGQCGADWQYPRLRCLHCGNEDHNSQKYLSAEGRPEKMRVEVCDKCNGYHKVINSFDPTLPEMLTVEDLSTLHLDYIAEARGYARVAVR